jgi:hypothetical protein
VLLCLGFIFFTDLIQHIVKPKYTKILCSYMFWHYFHHISSTYIVWISVILATNLSFWQMQTNSLILALMKIVLDVFITHPRQMQTNSLILATNPQTNENKSTNILNRSCWMECLIKVSNVSVRFNFHWCKLFYFTQFHKWTVPVVDSNSSRRVPNVSSICFRCCSCQTST